MNSPLTRNHWTVTTVEKDRIHLSGGDAAATIRELSTYGRRAMIRIDREILRFLYIAADGNEANVADVTAIEENGNVILTRGTFQGKDRPVDVHDRFVHRTDDEILDKRALFYWLLLKENGAGFDQKLIPLLLE